MASGVNCVTTNCIAGLKDKLIHLLKRKRGKIKAEKKPPRHTRLPGLLRALGLLDQ